MGMKFQSPETVFGEASPVAADYYWRHFRTVTDTAIAGHGHLFSDEERERIDTLLALPIGAQQLFVRLLSRKGDLFRVGRLDYPEIGDLAGPVSQLCDAGFAQLDPPDALADGSAISLLTLPELRGIARELDLRTGGRKDELLARVRRRTPS